MASKLSFKAYDQCKTSNPNLTNGTPKLTNYRQTLRLVYERISTSLRLLFSGLWLLMCQNFNFEKFTKSCFDFFQELK